MSDNQKVIHAIFEAIDEVNKQLPEESYIVKSVDTKLHGSEVNLDSLTLVSLVTMLEQEIEDNFGASITILGDIEDIENENPFETIKTLANYVASLLEKMTIE